MRKHSLLFVPMFLMAAIVRAEAPPVAVVLGRSVPTSEIEPRPDKVARQKAALDSEAFARWLLKARAKQLSALVQSRLFDSYAERNGLKPTEAEMQPLLRTLEGASKQADESFKRARQRRMDDIRKKLADPTLDPAERAKLTADLSQWEQLPSRIESRAQEGGREMMVLLAQNWKVQRSLHQRHGGRVLLSSFGFHVAIDATKQFLREEEKRGSFEVSIPPCARPSGRRPRMRAGPTESRPAIRRRMCSRRLRGRLRDTTNDRRQRSG